jgi:Calcium/calmodulin dependent protein kinase II Association.
MKTQLTYIIIIFLLCSVAGCSNTSLTNRNNTQSNDSIASLILNKESAILKRWYNGDPMGFIENSWNDVSYFDATLSSRTDSLEAYKKLFTPLIGKVHVPSHTMYRPRVQIAGETAILTFTDILDLGNSKTMRWHATEVYQRRGKVWKLIHSHWTESKVK